MKKLTIQKFKMSLIGGTRKNGGVLRIRSKRHRHRKKADKKKVAHAIAVIGKTTYDVLKDLCLPDKPTEKSFKEVCSLLKGYYRPSMLVVAEVYKFHHAQQEVGESVSMYANRLRRLSANCQFDKLCATSLSVESRIRAH